MRWFALSFSDGRAIGYHDWWTDWMHLKSSRTKDTAECHVERRGASLFWEAFEDKYLLVNDNLIHIKYILVHAYARTYISRLGVITPRVGVFRLKVICGFATGIIS